MAKIIDGKTIAEAVRARVAREAEDFRTRHGRAPGLHVILAGDDPASAVYVRGKEKAAKEAGMVGAVHRLPADVSEAELLSRVRDLNQDESVDGILVQLPVPAQIRSSAVIEAIDPKKDVDGLHPDNVGRLWSGHSGLVPCTPRGCMELLKSVDAKLEGAEAVVVGRSNLMGKPMAALLLAAQATVTLAHSRTRELSAVCRRADVLVAAVGRARFIQGSWLKPGCVVIDVGINRNPDGTLCGDVDFATAEPVAAAITPVPRGVGPMTIAMLLDNTVQAARARRAG